VGIGGRERLLGCLRGEWLIGNGQVMVGKELLVEGEDLVC